MSKSRLSLRLAAATGVVVIAVAAVPGATALEADDLYELLGYTMVAHSHVEGEFEGADYGASVRLDNGWVFEFADFGYTYSYRPAVAVFAWKVDEAEARRLGAAIRRPITLYKLIIDDEIYDARRLR